MARFLRRNSGSRQRVSRRKRLTPEPHVKAAYWLVPLVPGCEVEGSSAGISVEGASVPCGAVGVLVRSEEHTSELQSIMRISYAVFRLKKKRTYKKKTLP